MFRRTVTIDAAALSSAADMIADHIGDAPHAGMMGALTNLSEALSLAAMSVQREGARRVRIELLESI